MRSDTSTAVTIVFGLGVLVLVVVLWDPFKAAVRPRHVFTELRTELVFDGQRLTLEGTTYCKRSPKRGADGEKAFLVILDRGPAYMCRPQWLGTRLPDGSALLVSAYSVASTWTTGRSGHQPSHMTAQKEFLAKAPRAVLWLDDAERPKTGEYYFSSAALSDPRSRLSSLRSEVVAVTSASRLSYFFRRKPETDPGLVIPWAAGGGGDATLYGIAALSLGRAQWDGIVGLAEQLAGFAEPHRIDPFADITEPQRRALIDLRDLPSRLVMPAQWTPAAAEGQNIFLARYTRFFPGVDRVEGLVAGDDGIYASDAALPKGALRLTIAAKGPDVATLRHREGRVVFNANWAQADGWGGMTFRPEDQTIRLYRLIKMQRQSLLQGR